MPFPRCFSTLGCPELSLEAALALAGRAGVPLIEVRTLGGTVDLAAHLQAEFGTPERMAEVVRRSPVRVVAFDASLHLVNATDAERAQLESIMPWAEALGVRWVRVFDGGKAADAAEFEEAEATLRWWRAQRAAHGWKASVMVETHDSLLGGDAIRRFAAALPGVAVLWDAHHTWRKGNEDPVATWKLIRGHVVHVHVKDSIPVASARHPFTYVNPGDGGFPIAPLLAALRADDFRGPVSLEWERQWHPYLPPLEDALRLAAARSWW